MTCMGIVLRGVRLAWWCTTLTILPPASEMGTSALTSCPGMSFDAKSKTRKEVEVGVSDRAKTEDILLSLGFRKTLDVVKTRSIWHYQGAEICLDRIEGLGEFVELESLADNPADIGRKRDELIALMRDLGIEGELIRESYLEMLLKRKTENS